MSRAADRGDIVGKPGSRKEACHRL